MSYYTQFNFKVTLSKEFAEKGFLDYIRCVINEDFVNFNPASRYRQVRSGSSNNHPFFGVDIEKWSSIFDSNTHISYEGEGKLKPNVIQVREKGCVRLELHGAINNAGKVFERFFKLIAPYIVTRKKKKYIGWTFGEMDRQRTYHHIRKVYAVPCIINGIQVTEDSVYTMHEDKDILFMPANGDYNAYRLRDDYPNVTGLISVLSEEQLIKAVGLKNKDDVPKVYMIDIGKDESPENALNSYLRVANKIPLSFCLCIEDINKQLSH